MVIRLSDKYALSGSRIGGNIMASIISPYTRPQAATVPPNVFTAAAPDPAGRS